MSDQPGSSKCLCPLENVMDIISRKWALLVINTIGNREKIRYNEIMKTLKGINSKTLADRLKELEEFGIITRKAYAEIPPRVEYSLTKDGMELQRAITPLLEWVDPKNGNGTTPCDIALERAPETNGLKNADIDNGAHI